MVLSDMVKNAPVQTYTCAQEVRASAPISPTRCFRFSCTLQHDTVFERCISSRARGLEVLGKYLIATVVCRSARLCHISCLLQEQHLPFNKRRSAIAGEMRFRIPLSSSTSADERCIPSGKEASRRPPSRGGYSAIRIDPRVR